ncbi:GNAT family N-acetyltransferase [Halobaculum sp. P14]|uniref:GNAT family N-acetyltransferase n=1 Tax=Halobaculum sp. P14 TaxID=3421638 RepID=UPI003EBB86F5
MSRYELRDGAPSVDDFQRLRAAADMAARPRDGVERGLPNSLYVVRAVAVPDVADADGEVVGMARVVGDGGSVYHVCDTAVHPDHQRSGLGTRMMEAVVDWLREDAPAGAYVNLMADVDGFYERFGFRETRPASKGMFLRVE